MNEICWKDIIEKERESEIEEESNDIKKNIISVVVMKGAQEEFQMKENKAIKREKKVRVRVRDVIDGTIKRD